VATQCPDFAEALSTAEEDAFDELEAAHIRAHEGPTRTI
jgi:hypothetical protein